MQIFRGSMPSFTLALLLLALQFYQATARAGIVTIRDQATCHNLENWPQDRPDGLGDTVWDWLGQSVGEKALIGAARYNAINWFVSHAGSGLGPAVLRPDDSDNLYKWLRIGNTLSALFGGVPTENELKKIRGIYAGRNSFYSLRNPKYRFK